MNGNRKLNGKKNRKIRKTAGILAMGAMLMAGSFGTAYAAGTNPSASDRTEIAISGVEAGAEVTAYHVVEADYNKYGLIGYHQNAETAAAKKLKDLEDVRIEDVEALADATYWKEIAYSPEDVIKLEYDTSTGKYFTRAAEAGSYLVLVNSSDKTCVYNPMYVSNEYTDANSIGSLGGGENNGSVNAAEDKMTFPTLTGSRAYAKKDITALDKAVVEASTHETDCEDAAVGDTVTFEITNTVPDYSHGFRDIYYKFTDTQSAGLDSISAENIDSVATVRDGVETEIAPENYELEFGDHVWSIRFAHDWVQSHPYADVVMRYHTTVNGDAVFAKDANTNNVVLEYSTLGNGEHGALEDTVQIYTFRFNEAVKIDEDGYVSVEDGRVVGSAPLAGAAFELKGITDRNGKDISDRVYSCTTDETGTIEFSGLDEGKYTLYETDASDGRFLNAVTYTVTISAEYDDEGELLETYSVGIVNDETGTEVESVYNAESSGREDHVAGIGVINTHLYRLPSTGSAAPYIVLAIGAGIMAAGACLVLKKKDE